MIKIFAKLFCAFALFTLPGVSSAQDFIMGDMQVVNRHGEKLYAQIPLHGMSPDGYSTLSGQVVGFDDRVNFLDFSFKSKGPQIYFVITSSQALTTELAVQVFLSYKGVEKNAEYIIVPPAAPVIEVPSPVSLIEPAPLILSGASVDEMKYVEFTKQQAIVADGKIILPFRYDVKPGDSISTIVDRHINPYNASFHRSVLAMYHFNRDAFRNGDINKLIVGRTLTVPSAENFFAIDQSSARQNYFILVKGGEVAEDALVSRPITPAEIQNVHTNVAEPVANYQDIEKLRKLAEGLSNELVKLQSTRENIDQQIDENKKRLSEINALLSGQVADAF